MAGFVGFLIFTILILKIDGQCVEQNYTGVTVAENGALDLQILQPPKDNQITKSQALN